MTNTLDIFRKEFLEANTWEQRKDGIPLDLLDNLTEEELKIAETELIKVLSLDDSWPIVGLGHIKSKDALPKLSDLLDRSNGSMKVTIAHSIFQICQDVRMIDIVLNTMPRITNQFELIQVLYYLRDFKDKRVEELHDKYRNHKEYLVAYNATQSLGLSTKEVVNKFRKNKMTRNLWARLLGK